MQQNDVDSFNETKLKKALLNFDRKHIENQKLRIKHAESPTKFAASETELYASLDEIQCVATQPELYAVLASKNTLDTLLSLISHENTDISAKVVGILQELTDIDESDSQEPSGILIEALVSRNLAQLVVSNLSRLDGVDKDESQAIINSLAVIDNIIEYNTEFAILGSEDLIKWMVDTLNKSSGFNSIKLPIAELLSILLMSSDDNKLHLSEINGVDALLKQVAYYRRVEPKTGEEHEFLEQIVNCLCTAVLNCDENRNSFFEEEGVDLVELILREKREAIKKSNLKLSMLKLFNHVLTTHKNHDRIVTECCARFIDILGLRVIFPLFNNPKFLLNDKIKRREYHHFLDEVEEHTTAILLALLKNSQNTEHIQRILVKFAESSFGKLLRLLSLHDKYFMIVQNNSTAEDEAKLTPSSAYFTLRTIDYTILLVCYLTSQFETYDPTSGETFANFILKILAQRPQLRHQLAMETRRHIDEVADTREERESLTMLLEHFEGLSKSAQAKV